MIYLGSEAIDRAGGGYPPNYTYIDKNNPAVVRGKITSIEVWAASDMGGLEIATFYKPDPDNFPSKFTTRDTHNIGNVTAGSKQTFSELDIDVEEGDFIGYYWTSGQLEVDTSGGNGCFISALDVDNIPCTNQSFPFYYSQAISSLKALGTFLTVTTQDPTNILPTTVIGNGNITNADGENATVRGFEYGLTKTNTWEIYDEGDFGAGAFTKDITGLTANTTYWIRACATNTIGVSRGEWVQFQTAASGTIPAGTNLFICGDYTGYSYQLMKSETDDGGTYTGYFVISTDLTNKQGLAFYKRILDLHLYFRSESSGTALVEVKRDNEADWQTVGTVSLTGTEDIVILHLAPDIRAKVFLFKISATNFFRFLGVLFEYLPEGLR